MELVAGCWHGQRGHWLAAGDSVGGLVLVLVLVQLVLWWGLLVIMNGVVIHTLINV